MNKTATSPDLLDPDYWGNTIKMSLSKFFILCVLQYEDLHGYDIARQVEQRTDGCCTPREGTIYPVLKQFTEGGYVTFSSEIVSGRERKVYSVTEKGRQAFQVALTEWMKITRCLQECSCAACP
ncbi:PadR family transcriptional regulator [Roseobacter sp. EG26]|uniref:PadR family transcriptional regulator n=1 Tax=Roseobacter sp. EG26 TaxID=3412477 RepID=UPI003CE565E6